MPQSRGISVTDYAGFQHAKRFWRKVTYGHYVERTFMEVRWVAQRLVAFPLIVLHLLPPLISGCFYPLIPAHVSKNAKTDPTTRSGAQASEEGR